MKSHEKIQQECKLHPVVTELFIKGQKLNTVLVFITVILSAALRCGSFSKKTSKKTPVPS